MRKRSTAELHILNRILYLLEETSVDRVAKEDHSFSQFIDELYETIDEKAMNLAQQSSQR